MITLDQGQTAALLRILNSEVPPTKPCLTFAPRTGGVGRDVVVGIRQAGHSYGSLRFNLRAGGTTGSNFETVSVDREEERIDTGVNFNDDGDDGDNR